MPWRYDCDFEYTHYGTGLQVKRHGYTVSSKRLTQRRALFFVTSKVMGYIRKFDSPKAPDDYDPGLVAIECIERET